MLATVLDGVMTVLAGATVALILWKLTELHWPSLLGRAHLAGSVASLAELEEALERMEWGLGLLATTAATAPFLGLAGTVIRIIQVLTAFTAADTDLRAVAGALAGALSSTLLGLASAVPAAVAYNLCVRRLQLMENRARRSLAPNQAPAGGG